MSKNPPLALVAPLLESGLLLELVNVNLDAFANTSRSRFNVDAGLPATYCGTICVSAGLVKFASGLPAATVQFGSTTNVLANWPNLSSFPVSVREPIVYGMPGGI